MKKIFLILFLLICMVAAGTFFFYSNLSRNHEEPSVRVGQALEIEQVRKSVPPPEPPVPTARKEKVQEVKKPATLPPAAPFHVRFGIEEPPASDGVQALLLRVDADRDAWPLGLKSDAQMELLLRLPVSIRLESEGWEPQGLPSPEQKDPSGTWHLFVRTVPLSLGATVPEILVQEPVVLDVQEEGTNWVITVRARLVSGESAWQSFGVVFATRHGEEIIFHSAPRTDYLRR